MGLVRGFGGPQVYFALERLMQRIGVILDLDPLEVIRRNLVDRRPRAGPGRQLHAWPLSRSDLPGACTRGLDVQSADRALSRRRGKSTGGVGAPFCELGPAGTDQAIGIFGGHLDDAILSDG